MMLTDSQRFCLTHCPITIWRLRQQTPNYLVIYLESLSSEKNELLDKMLAAIRWTKADTQLQQLKNQLDLTISLQQSQAQHILVVGFNDESLTQ